MFKWHKLFSEGCEDSTPGMRGRPKEIDDKPVKLLEDTLREDRRRIVREIKTF